MKTDYVIYNDQMMYTIESLKENGLSHYKINQLVKMGVLSKLNNRFYENMNYEGEISDFYYAYAYAPDGVICLLSAAVYYGLSSYRPDAVDIALRRKAKVSKLPDWPELQIHYFTDYRYEQGIQTVFEGKNCFKIYDIEKTVADIVYYREKVGIEETKEILINYLNRRNRQLNRLIRYAELLKCDEVLKNYLEVLV